MNDLKDSMRYALFSDIHGNNYVLDAMLNDMQNEHIDGYLFCGDIAGYYYNAGKIVEAFRQLPNFYAVMGNHDALYLESLSNSSVQQEAIQSYGSAYNNINAETVHYLSTLPKTIKLSIGKYNILMMHGTPSELLSGRIYPDTDIEEIITTQLNCDFLFLGHTHYQMTRTLSDNCTIINPGSLGQPRDGKGFSYCVIDFSTGEIEHRRVHFDLSMLYNDITENDPNMPYLIDVLKRNEGV